MNASSAKPNTLLCLLVQGEMLTAKNRVNICDLSSMDAVKKELENALNLMSIGLLEVWDVDFQDWVAVDDPASIKDKSKVRVSYAETPTSSGGSMNAPVPRVGATLGGRYKLLGKLAAGGMGCVMKAEDSSLGGKIVAVKIPHDVAGGARMKQEAKFGGVISERTVHVMQIYDLKQEGELVYMVCEFLNGETIAKMLEKKKPDGLDEATIVQIAIGVLDALVAIHANGFVHRDVKPSNIMWVLLKPHVKLIDFGITKSTNAQENVVKTTTGGAPGTGPYMSPLALQRTADVRNDIWALAVSMIEAAIGYVPESLAFTAPVPVVELRQKGYSEVFIAFIDKALEKDPADGFQTAAEALKEAQSLIRKKTGLTTMKKQLKEILHNQEVVVRKIDENQALLLEQGAKLAAMASSFTNLDADMKVVMCYHRMQMRMTETLLRNENSIPRLLWISPKPKAKGFEWLGSLTKPSTWLYDTVLVSFVCPHGMHVVPCGPSGSGYEMQMTKAWIKKWGPVILTTCIIVQVGLAAGQVMGLPLPSISAESIRPNMNDGAKRSLMQQQIEMAKGMAAEAKEQMGPAASQALQQLEVPTDYDAPHRPQQPRAEITEAQKLTGASYQALKAFVEETDPQKQHYGLVKEVHNGYMDWVAPQNVGAWRRACDARAQREAQGVGVGAGQQQVTRGEWCYRLANGTTIMPKVLPDTRAAPQPGARKLLEGGMFAVTERRQGTGQTYLKLQTGGWAFTHNPTTGAEICTLHPSSPISSPFLSSPPAAPAILRGRVEMKVKGAVFGSSWLKGTCDYNAHEFTCIDSTGKERRAIDCWLVDVANREGKRQHRFDIDSDGSQQPMALAAEGAGEKQRWVAAVETKQALRARQEQEMQEQALMAKHGVGTIEEARSKEAEAVQRQKEQAEHRRREAEEERLRKEAERQAEWKARREADEQYPFLRIDTTNPMAGGVVGACGADIAPLMSSEMIDNMCDCGYAFGDGDSSPCDLVQLEHDGVTKNMTGFSGDGFDSWVRLDLHGCFLLLNHYSLRHGNIDGGYRLINWQLQGSNDGQEWEVLKEHSNDQSLPDEGFGVAHWPVNGVSKAYRCFRILKTGKSAISGRRGEVESARREDLEILCCAGINLFGQLFCAVPAAQVRQHAQESRGGLELLRNGEIVRGARTSTTSTTPICCTSCQILNLQEVTYQRSRKNNRGQFFCRCCRFSSSSPTCCVSTEKHNVNGPSTLCGECSVYGYCASCGEQIQRNMEAPGEIECTHCHVPVLTAKQILAHHGQTEEAELAAEKQAKRTRIRSRRPVGFTGHPRRARFDDPGAEISCSGLEGRGLEGSPGARWRCASCGHLSPGNLRDHGWTQCQQCGAIPQRHQGRAPNMGGKGSGKGKGGKGVQRISGAEALRLLSQGRREN
jgi:serine/threonine-protein kinase